jgi:hypothetical protein
VSARSLSWGGLAAGPLGWAVSTQANYALVPWACARGLAPVVVPGVAAACILLVAVGGLLSWRAWRAHPAAPREAGGHPWHFLGALGAGLAVLFAVVIALHAAGTLFFTGCEW